MKTPQRLLILGLIFLGALLSEIAHAEKMNSNTQDLVIKKMERVLSVMEKSDPSWLATQQRLADLLSERARTRFMMEVEVRCEGCKGSKDDRQRAIKIYETLLAETKINERGEILFHLAHLYEMAGDINQAITLFERIITEAKAKKIPNEILFRSHSGLGDLLFQKVRFKEARQNYSIALKDKDLPNRALVIYNMAWCEFNSDNLNGGIRTLESLLKNPKAITRDTDEGSVHDPVFHVDIIRDLATFYSRQPITSDNIETYEKILPAEKRKELLLHFAIEADRIGQKDAAHKVLSRYLALDGLSKEEQLEAFVRMAQINYDRGQTAASTQDFAKAAAAFKYSDCEDTSKCQELQKTMKRYVTELHRSKKLKPDQDLLNAYVIYNRTFPSDGETTQRGAQVAMEMERWPLAVQFYRTISQGRSFNEKERQVAMLAEISAAEKSKDPSLQKAAYLHYLDNSNGRDPKNFEVRYQIAYLSYQQKQLKEAASAFNVLALDKNGREDLRKKSADLSLDCLAQLKAEDSLQDWSMEYAKAFPQARREFQALAHKALMNEVATIANNRSSDSSSLKSALKKMLRTEIPSHTTQEKILFYNNQSVLAQKVADEEVYIESVRKLLAIPQLDSARREELREQLAAFYERKLDFKNAYSMALQLENKKIPPQERELRLGTLADLAEMNPEKHYQAALKAGMKGDRALMIRSRLVLLSSQPAKELKKQTPHLKQKPVLLNETVLLVYAKTLDKKSLQSVLTMKELRNQSASQLISKQRSYDKLQALAQTIHSHVLNMSSDRAMQKSIQERIKLLSRADSALQEAVSIKDITSQLWALAIVSTENDRLVRDLAALPMPAGLSTKEQQQYIQILKEKSKPFLYKSKVAQQKQKEIWNHSKSIMQLTQDYRIARPEIQNLLSREMQLLAQLPGQGPMKELVRETLNLSPYSPKDLASARKSVAANPEDTRQIEILRNLETKIGHPLMPSYLEARLSHLQKGKSL